MNCTTRFGSKLLFKKSRIISNQTVLRQVSSGWNQEERKYNPYGLATVGLALGLSAHLYYKSRRNKLQAAEPVGKIPVVTKGLPEYKMKDVNNHSSKETGIWVSFGGGVYDITKFIDQHPGGDAILIAAGGSLEPFWLLYGVHKQPHVLKMLEEYRIGNLDPEDVNENVNTDDPYAWEPRRHPSLKPSSTKPFNAEPPPELLVESFLTPQPLFYVRNHLPVPDIKEEDYTLEIEGLGIKSKCCTLAELKKLPKHTITAAVMCAGNRRSEMNEIKLVKGLNWGFAAIGNATWSGPRLYDVLKSLGLDENTNALHVQFEGLDTDATNKPYGASIPIEKLLDPKGDVILAYEMNGEPLSRDHGYPIRVIVPGIVGARNVKWLGKIIVSEKESDSHWQQSDYKGFSPSTDWDTVDFSKSPAIQELPVISAICVPKQNQEVKINNDNTVLVKGYAWSGGGRKIVRVDLTANQGKSWYVADLVSQDDARHPHHWGWTLWQAKIPVDAKCKEVQIWAKAVDSSYNTQPEEVKNIWNLRGVLSNAYHKVNVKLKK